MIISFLIVPLDEINYEVRHIKLHKIQNQPFAGILKGFLKNFAKFTEIHLRRSPFIIKWQVSFEKILWFFMEHLGATTSENERLSFVQN